MSLYRLQSRDLKGLDSNKAVDFFRRLLWSEASRVHVGNHLIDAPDCINVGDGGLDAIILDAKPSSEELIPNGTSGFQIKSSDLSPSGCKKELKTAQGDLKPAIRSLLEKNGTYILVLFEEMPPETLKREREKAIFEELCNLGFTPRIRVYTINQLIGYAEKFPALVSWLKGYEIACLPYEKWANNRDVSYPKTYFADDQRDSIKKEIRETIRNPERNSTVLRITGSSGLGKTRLIFESLSPEDLRNIVLYTTAGAFKIRFSKMHCL